MNLPNKEVLVCVNLKPIKLRGEMSHGMILSASDGDHYQVVEQVDDGCCRVSWSYKSPLGSFYSFEFFDIPINYAAAGDKIGSTRSQYSTLASQASLRTTIVPERTSLGRDVSL